MYEFKTIQNIPEKPKIEHIMQLQSYYSMLDLEKQSKIKKLCIVYFSLNKIKTYEVPKLDMLNYLEARGSVLANSLKISSPPPREESYICNYCDFKDICFKRDKEL
jgi:CRISPR/Cas system-associated exonuclease Cas4 (RecB family)